MVFLVTQSVLRKSYKKKKKKYEEAYKKTPDVVETNTTTRHVIRLTVFGHIYQLAEKVLARYNFRETKLILIL